jgi:hypothetical protein
MFPHMMKHTVMLELHEWKYVTAVWKDTRIRVESALLQLASRLRVLYEKIKSIDL